MRSIYGAFVVIFVVCYNHIGMMNIPRPGTRMIRLSESGRIEVYNERTRRFEEEQPTRNSNRNQRIRREPSRIPTNLNQHVTEQPPPISTDRSQNSNSNLTSESTPAVQEHSTNDNIGLSFEPPCRNDTHPVIHPRDTHRFHQQHYDHADQMLSAGDQAYRAYLRYYQNHPLPPCESQLEAYRLYQQHYDRFRPIVSIEEEAYRVHKDYLMSHPPSPCRSGDSGSSGSSSH